MNDCSGDERVGGIQDDFIGRSHALHDLDGGAEVATYFDIAEFDLYRVSQLQLAIPARGTTTCCLAK